MIRCMRALPFPVLAGGLLLAGGAQAETTTSARVGVEAGYGSRPFLGSSGGANETASLISRFEPSVTLSSPTSQVRLGGNVEHTIFSKGRRDITNWGLGAAFTVSLTPLSRLGLTGNYSSRVRNGFSGYIDPVPPEDGEAPPTDPWEAELAGSRTKTLSGGANYSTALSARTSLNLSGFVSDVSYDDSPTIDHGSTSYGGSIGLSRAMGQNSSIGVSLGYSASDYDTAQLGSFTQISPRVTAALQIAPRVTLSGSVGAGFTRTRQPAGTRNHTNFMGDAALCHAGDRSRLCAFAARSIGSGINAGTSTTTSAGLRYSYKLTPRSSIGASGQYSEVQSIGLGIDRSYSQASGSANYQRELAPRLSLSVTARYTNPITSTFSRRESLYGGVGVNYRLGR